jgi:polyisoprenoid-binding protein YceI
MKEGRFQWTMIFLTVLVIGMLGVTNFLLWNQQGGQQGERENPGGREHFAQREMGGDEGDSTLRSGQRETNPPPKSESPELGKKGKAESHDGERTDNNQIGLGKKTKPEPEVKAKSEPEAKAKVEPQETKAAPTFDVDVGASRVFVKVGSATRLGHEHGVEGKLKAGKIQLGAGGELVFDMKSFQADTTEARKRVGLEGKRMSENEATKVTQNMRGPDVLDVEKFPTATFKIIAIKPAERQDAGSPGFYQVDGRFDLHGAEQPLKFRAKLAKTDKEGVMKLGGAFFIKQTDYGMTPFSAAGGITRVADELDIYAELFISQAK